MTIIAQMDILFKYLLLIYFGVFSAANRKLSFQGVLIPFISRLYSRFLFELIFQGAIKIPFQQYLQIR